MNSQDKFYIKEPQATIFTNAKVFIRVHYFRGFDIVFMFAEHLNVADCNYHPRLRKG